jgi:hypothetical protein
MMLEVDFGNISFELIFNLFDFFDFLLHLPFALAERFYSQELIKVFKLGDCVVEGEHILGLLFDSIHPFLN